MRGMDTDIVLTLLGPDRPGLVEAVASRVADRGGNWLESRLARLAGQFAGVAHVRVPAGEVEALLASLRELDASDAALMVVAQRAEGDAVVDEAEVKNTTRELRLDLVGHDRPGIVREVSRALAQAGVNVTRLNTSTTSAPMTGEPLFQAQAELHAPADADLEALRRRLEGIADELHLDLHLTPA